MFRLFLSLAFVLALATPGFAKEDDAPLGPPGATLEQVQNHPADQDLLNKFVGTAIREINALVQNEKFDQAQAKLKAFEAQLSTLKPEGEEAKELMERVNAYLKRFPEQIALARLTLAETEKALTARPDDPEALENWTSKIVGELYGMAYGRPDEAEAKLAAAKEFAAKIAAAAKEEETKKSIAALSRSFSQVEQAIEKGREYLPLIGKDAAPLAVKTWVNGTPLTAGDLKDKVVLLDFWAVWCGPCIATFPHLREWHEKYADKGLVIIGLTSYYDYRWDDEAGYAARGTGEVSDEEEEATLKKFADYYHLKHRFAIQEEGNSLSDYYGVSGIPHVVVLDKQGKVRMIRVGSGKQNAQDIDELLAELLK